MAKREKPIEAVIDPEVLRRMLVPQVLRHLYYNNNIPPTKLVIPCILSVYLGSREITVPVEFREVEHDSSGSVGASGDSKPPEAVSPSDSAEPEPDG